MLKTIENKIRFNAILIYIVVIIICGAIALYFFNSREKINTEKKNIEQYYQELSRTNELIHTINLAQSEANLFVATKYYKHLKSFREYFNQVELMVDELIIDEKDSSKNKILLEIKHLLQEKGRSVSKLNNQFNISNPFEPLNEKLNTYASPTHEDSIIVTTIIQDTIIKVTQKKGFWSRIANIFAPEKTVDSVITIKSLKIDTLQIPHTDSLSIISEMNQFADQASQDYISNI